MALRSTSAARCIQRGCLSSQSPSIHPARCTAATYSSQPCTLQYINTPSRHHSTASPLGRHLTTVAQKITAAPFSSSHRSRLLTATACISAALACAYTAVTSCDAEQTSHTRSSAATRGHTFASATQLSPLSPVPELTGSNSQDWQLVHQLQSLLAQPDSSLTPAEQHYLTTHMSDPHTCYRYLLARSGDTQRAAQAIKHTTRWRLENNVDALTATQLIDKVAESNMWVSDGIARDGTPLIINRKSTAAETDHDRQFQLIVYTLERALRILALQRSTQPPPSPEGAVALSVSSHERWSWFLDLSAFTSGSSTPLSETRRIVDTLMSHYVERLNVAVILDAPSYFYWVWRAVSVVIPAKTKAKVVFLYDLNNEETQRKLQQYIDLDELEKPYGLREKMTLERYLATEPKSNAALDTSKDKRSKG